MDDIPYSVSVVSNIKNFAILTAKHLCLTLFLIKLQNFVVVVNLKTLPQPQYLHYGNAYGHQT